MTTKEEREVIQKKSFDITNAAAGKDRHAQDYLWMIARITRTLDDLYDQDQFCKKRGSIGSF